MVIKSEDYYFFFPDLDSSDFDTSGDEQHEDTTSAHSSQNSTSSPSSSSSSEDSSSSECEGSLSSTSESTDESDTSDSDSEESKDGEEEFRQLVSRRKKTKRLRFEDVYDTEAEEGTTDSDSSAINYDEMRVVPRYIPEPLPFFRAETIQEVVQSAYGPLVPYQALKRPRDEDSSRSEDEIQTQSDKEFIEPSEPEDEEDEVIE